MEWKLDDAATLTCVASSGKCRGCKQPLMNLIEGLDGFDPLCSWDDTLEAARSAAVGFQKFTPASSVVAASTSAAPLGAGA
mgnify:CR=1 FL=1